MCVRTNDERSAVFSCGAVERLSGLKQRLALAQSKVRHFEEKYQIAPALLESDGLPDQADFEMHEDYIMWHHWDSVVKRTRKELDETTV